MERIEHKTLLDAITSIQASDMPSAQRNLLEGLAITYASITYTLREKRDPARMVTDDYRLHLSQHVIGTLIQEWDHARTIKSTDSLIKRLTNLEDNIPQQKIHKKGHTDIYLSASRLLRIMLSEDSFSRAQTLGRYIEEGLSSFYDHRELPVQADSKRTMNRINKEEYLFLSNCYDAIL